MDYFEYMAVKTGNARPCDLASVRAFERSVIDYWSERDANIAMALSSVMESIKPANLPELLKRQAT